MKKSLLKNNNFVSGITKKITRKPYESGKKRGRKTVHNFECVDYDKGLFRCYKCTYESTIHGVRKHIQRHHGSQLECEICGHMFGTKFDLRRHQKTHYNKDGTLNIEAEAWQRAKQEKQMVVSLLQEIYI